MPVDSRAILLLVETWRFVLHGRYAGAMGKRRGKKSRAKKIDVHPRLGSLVNGGNRGEIDAEVFSDAGADQNRERPRPSSPGIFGAVFRVMVCSVLCLQVTWLILRACLAVPDVEVVPKMFKGIGEQAYNQGATGSVSILAGIATIALTLRGMSWRSRELPEDSILHRAWLQKVIDDSARERWAFSLLVLLSGLYGAVVVTYGVLAGYNDWPGVSRILLIFLSVVYLVVATLPAFVQKSEIGTIEGYVDALVRVANVGEWRCFNLRNRELYARKYGVTKFIVTREVMRVLWVKDVDGCWRRAVRFSGLWGHALIFIISVLTEFANSGAMRMTYGVIIYVILVCFVPEIMLVWMLGLKCRVISTGRIDVDVVVEGFFVVFLSLLPWGLQLYIITAPLFRCVVAVLFFWWFVRAVLACSVKVKRRCWPSRLWEYLSVVAGLQCVMGVWVDWELRRGGDRVISYYNDNMLVVDELSVAAGLIVPEKYVVNRICDDGQVESTNLREYLSEVVKVTLPPVLDTGSCTGKQGEWERTPLARTALCR